MVLVLGGPSKDSYCESTAHVCNRIFSYVIKDDVLRENKQQRYRDIVIFYIDYSISAWPYQQELHQVENVFSFRSPN